MDEDFSNALLHNTICKYRAAFDKDPDNNISLEPLSLTDHDKYTTKFNDHIVIFGWNGTYKLSGDPELLTFLYDAGLGSRNSQGFGMFEV